MADTQEAPQLTGENMPGTIREAQEALLSIAESEGNKPQEEEATPTEEEESTEEIQDESLEEEPESEESEEDEIEEGADEREVEGEDVVYAVTVDGEELQVPLDELLKGYSRTEDYTRKTQNLSEQRKEMDAVKQQWAAEVQQIQTERQQYVAALQNVVENSMGNLDQFANINWETLKTDNPLEYITKRDEYRDAQEKVRQAQYQQQHAQAAYQQEAERTRHQVLQEEHGRLVKVVPEWAEQETRQQLSKDIKEYALSQGYTQEEIASLVDHRSLVTIMKAMKYDKASSPEVTKKKVKNKPRVIRAGSPKSKAQSNSGKRNAQMKRLQESGHVRDASHLFEDFVDI